MSAETTSNERSWKKAVIRDAILRRCTRQTCTSIARVGKEAFRAVIPHLYADIPNVGVMEDKKYRTQDKVWLRSRQSRVCFMHMAIHIAKDSWALGHSMDQTSQPGPLATYGLTQNT